MFKKFFEKNENQTKIGQEQPIGREKQIVNKEIEELEASLRTIVEQILSKIESGRYSVIIGVDASGRIPTLIISRFVGYVYKKLGLENPRVIFVAGGLKDENEIGKYLESVGLSAQDGALLVEDTLVSGNSVQGLTQALKNKGINFDFVAVGAFAYDDAYLFKNRIKYNTGADDVYFGSTGQPLIYGERQLGGGL